MEKLQKIDFLLFLLFFTGLVFAWRAVSSISVGLIILSGLIKIIFFRQKIRTREHMPFIACCILLFIIQFFSLPFTSDEVTNWNKLVLKSGLLLVPLAAIFSVTLPASLKQLLMRSFVLLLLVAALYCLGTALFHFTRNAAPQVFFYHKLVAPLHQHAVYFSILVFIGMVYMIERLRKGLFNFKPGPDIIIIIFFTSFIFLLASKLLITILLLYLVSCVLMLVKNKTFSRMVVISVAVLILAGSVLLVLIPNPVSKRFREITNSRLEHLNKDRYDRGAYFDGLQFRLLQWKWVSEILDEKNSWIKGVTPGDAQHELDELYTSKNMHEGYRGYNTHNQFLESLLQNGVPGAILFLLTSLSLLYLGFRSRSVLVKTLVVLLVSWSFIESVFETQYGIFIFCFFPVWVNLLDKFPDK